MTAAATNRASARCWGPADLARRSVCGARLAARTMLPPARGTSVGCCSPTASATRPSTDCCSSGRAVQPRAGRRVLVDVPRDHRGTDTPPPPPLTATDRRRVHPGLRRAARHRRADDCRGRAAARRARARGRARRWQPATRWRRSPRRHGARYFRRGVNTGAKAGNINHALARTDAPFVVVLDCDHVPGGRLLPATLGYFADDARRVRADPAVLRERGRGGVPRRRGRSSRSSSARSLAARTGTARCSAAARTSCSGAVHSKRSVGSRDSITEDFELSVDLHERGWRSRVRAEGPGARARTGGHGVLRESAAPLGARLPVGAPPRAARPRCRSACGPSTCCRRCTS